MSAAPRWAVVGFGRTGRCFAKLLHDAGVLATVWGRRQPEATAFYDDGMPFFCSALPDLANADIVLLALPDDALGPFVRALPEDVRNADHRTWLHLSGALAGEVLRKAGALGPVGSCHPLVSFSGTPADLEQLAGAFFAVEGDAPAVERAKWLAAQCGASADTIPSESKAAYHAAAVLASNGVYALLRAAQQLCEDAGISSAALPMAMAGLARGSADNAAHAPLTTATTGPVVRGDANTVHTHLDVLSRNGDGQALYRAVSTWLLRIAREGETARERSLDAIDAVLASEDA